jgi:predicted Rossmann fold nucleotide-binding protein DprA/Smf involved in DNA uptake
MAKLWNGKPYDESKFYLKERIIQDQPVINYNSGEVIAGETKYYYLVSKILTPNQQRILNCISNEFKAIEDIAKEIGLSQTCVRNNLNKYELYDKIETKTVASYNYWGTMLLYKKRV